jgi:hypothetical protein
MYVCEVLVLLFIPFLVCVLEVPLLLCIKGLQVSSVYRVLISPGLSEVLFYRVYVKFVVVW